MVILSYQFTKKNDMKFVRFSYHVLLLNQSIAFSSYLFF